MSFMIAYFTIALSSIVITSRTLIAYTNCSLWLKAAVYAFFCIAWFAPIILWNVQTHHLVSVRLYTILAKVGYFFLGFSFLLIMAILLRDVLWTGMYFLSGKHLPAPNNPAALNCVNIWTLLVLAVVSIYAVFAAEKMPEVRHYEYSDARIKKPLKVLLIADLHITQMISRAKVENWVKLFNEQGADVVLLAGDIADDSKENIKEQISELKKLRAPNGIFYVTGNHEVYHNAFEWEAIFAGLGWQVLHNSGVSVENSGVYVAGLPDINGFSTNIAQAVKNAAADEYRILMSHEPVTALKIAENQVDLQVSGHTHGGQIFPFNWFVKLGNAGFVWGEYALDNAKLLITRGAGYWGPPMRLLAPSDVMLIEFKPQINEQF